MKPKSGRTIPLYFKVSPEEKAVIEKKMEQLGTHNQRAYLRKMAVDGYVVQVDMTDVKELAVLLRNCSNNLNQIARRVNGTGNLYDEDVADLKVKYGSCGERLVRYSPSGKNCNRFVKLSVSDR